MKNKKAFTLIELLIVLVIISILIGVLFDVYITIAKISYRVELQKHVNEELYFISETLQNLSNRNEIDYDKYGTWLFNTTWMTDTLYLSWEDWKVAIYSSWVNCESSWVCNLYMKKGTGSKEIQLTQDSVYFSKAQFKIIPFERLDYTDSESICEKKLNAYACRFNQWFWFMVNIYSSRHDSSRWTNDVYLNVQQFFNI